MEDDDEQVPTCAPPLRMIAVILMAITIVASFIFVMICYVSYPSIKDPETRKLYRDAVETAEVYFRNKMRREGKYSWKNTPLTLDPYKDKKGKMYVVVTEGDLVYGLLFLEMSPDGRRVIGEKWDSL